MAQIPINVDPEKLRSFADELTNFTEVVDEIVNTLKRNISHLGETWRDEEFKKFQGEFESVQRYLGKFAETARETTPVLRRDADSVEEYLKFKP